MQPPVSAKMRCFLLGSHFEGSFLFFFYIFLHYFFLLRTCTDHFRGVSTSKCKSIVWCGGAAVEESQVD